MTTPPIPTGHEAAPDVPADRPDDQLAARIGEWFAFGGSRLMRDFELTIAHAEPGRVRFELEVVPRLCHAGGVLSGQAIMACMDTGMVFVMMSIAGTGDGRFTTVELKTTFERGVPDDVGTVTFEAWATRTGRSIVFGQVDLLLPDGRRAATATTTYLWL